MMRRFFRTTALPPLLALVLITGCADNAETAPDGGTPNNCAPGLKPMGPACVPIFDECQDDEVPMLGGGCKRVGIKECLDGWGLIGPPDWTCKPIGPPRTCLKGWENVAGGWCEPILPKTKCPVGTIEKIGYATCQPIGDCGTGTWGNIKTTASTIYVDQNHTRTGGKGTKTEPFKTIGEALNKATTGDHIAVAAGTYVEQVSIQRKNILEGRCAQVVTIKVGLAKPAVEMKDWANGALLRGVTITGAGLGLRVQGVDVTVERVAVMGCEGSGIEVGSSGRLTLRDSWVGGNQGGGVLLYSSMATIERSVVRDTRERASDKQFGMGIQASVETGLSEGSELVLQDSLVAGNRYMGISLASSKATVERSVVRDTWPRASDNHLGYGIQATVQSDQTWGSELLLRHSLVAENRAAGVSLYSSKATLDRSVVRDTREQASDRGGGVGIQAAVFSGQGQGSDVVLQNSLVARNRTTGVALYSSKVTMERSVVRDTRERTADKGFGIGIQAVVQPGQSKGSEVVLRDCLVNGNQAVGVLLYSAQATVDRSVVRNTRGRTLDQQFGTGIEASVQPGQSKGSDLILRDSLVANNRMVGIVLGSSQATVDRSVVRDTLPQASDQRFGMGVQALVRPGQSQGSVLTLRDSLVAGNRLLGVDAESSQVKLERSLVRDTREQELDKLWGLGVMAIVQSGQSRGAELVLYDSLVTSNRSTGILVASSKATVERSQVRGTLKDVHGMFGDGIVVADKALFTIRDTTVERCARAGFIFLNSGGSVNRCLIRGNVFAIDLEEGAAPKIAVDNEMVDNQINHVLLGRGLKAAPIPPVPILSGRDAGPDAGVGAQ